LLCAQPFLERMLANQQLQLAEHLLVTTLGEVAVDPVHDHGQAQLVELRHLVSSDRLEREPGQRRAAPESQRLVQKP
jgi:hypothetical protein